ncbi:NAD-dependent epimerase/dehydratase family protein [Streptomyces alanosinicus]|uniref:dTDP-glucose 4,6-dehydratase n=1 Tax=Streptomyces alanosinicus TaxID=68171 RepID=A0A918YQ74_9ACTN|nr:NAD(P)-dependent oxidoreductase [Streptomyces alanosinicus]GHE12644.1 dTDP-glucose 4,6-dehydratase [Streptomyces alanosinicus]
MRIFVAGATGAIGRRLVPLLIEAGHDVIGATRTPGGLDTLRALGADARQLDVFDAEAVTAAVAEAAPDVVMHQLTSLAAGNPADNARIRVEGTRNLVDAAKRAGVTRIVAQSISWAYAPGTEPAREHHPLDLDAPAPRATTIGGIRALEDAVAELPHHVILRYGTLYGPGTWFAPGGLMADKLAAGTLPANAGVSSFVHVDDAARAAVAALAWPAGPVNIVDDEPAAARVWVPVLADALKAPVPEPVEGGAGWERGADAALARSRGWQPTHRSWRTGFSAQG